MSPKGHKRTSITEGAICREDTDNEAVVASSKDVPGISGTAK